MVGAESMCERDTTHVHTHTHKKWYEILHSHSDSHTDQLLLGGNVLRSSSQLINISYKTTILTPLLEDGGRMYIKDISSLHLYQITGVNFQTTSFFIHSCSYSFKGKRPFGRPRH